MNSVFCLSWVRRQAAKETPDRLKLNPDELQQLLQQTKTGAASAEGDDQENNDDLPSDSVYNKPGTSGTSSVPQEEDKMDIEDDEDVAESDEGEEQGRLSLGNVAYYSSIDDDPYIQEKDKLDSDEEADLKIKPSDSLIVIGRVKKDYYNLEVYVYEEDENNLYCHHDIMLPSFPLAVEWMDFDPGEPKPGNMAAVSTMEPYIELWDLDVIDTLEPAFVLGSSQSKKKKKKNTANSHSDAVLDLSWNRNQRNALASASADFTIGLWDMNEGKMVVSLRDHSEKVQAVHWHPVEAQTLLSGSFDHTVKVYDCRSPADGSKSWNLAGEVESVLWNHHDPFCFLASTDKGDLYNFDVRGAVPLFTLKAHSDAVPCLSLSSSIPGCLFTASGDKTTKIWDIRNNQPELVWEHTPKIGQVHCGAFCPDSSLLIAAGGEGEVKVMNLMKQGKVRAHFGIAGEGGDADEMLAVASSGNTADADTDEEVDMAVSQAAAVPKKSKKKKKKKKPHAK